MENPWEQLALFSLGAARTAPTSTRVATTNAPQPESSAAAPAQPSTWHERGPANRQLRPSGGRRLRERAFEVVAETLWPTRCALCDAPGQPLCTACTQKLPYINILEACPRCGAPFGRIQCTECNRVLLAPFGYERPPYAGAASALELTESARRIVTVYKDQGERGLARPMAAIMARYLPPAWLAEQPVVAFVPATGAARRRRGFDHAEQLARELSWLVECDFAPLLAQPRRLDQRKLSRTQRIENMRAALSTLPGATVPKHVILIDDVCTTGATLFAATEALKKGGAAHVHCITFART